MKKSKHALRAQAESRGRKVVIVVAVLTLTHRYSTIRGHSTGSNNSGVEDYLRRKTNNNRR